MLKIQTQIQGGLRDRTIMELLFSSGLRIAELVALNTDQMFMLKDGKTDDFVLTVRGW